MSRACAALFALLALLWAPPGAARVFSGIVWGDSGDPADPRRLDVHAPESPGPHPMVVLAGVDDAEVLARALAERGHVVAVLAAYGADTPASLAKALAFVFWRGAGYGGEANRLHVVGGPRSAAALLALAADAGALRAAGVPEDPLHALAVVGWRGPLDLPLSGHAGTPAALLIVAPPGQAADAHSAARLAEQWRARGAIAEWVVAEQGRVPHEGTADALLRWLERAALLRTSRFESLRFAATAEALPEGVRAAGMAVDGGALLLAGDGTALSVWRRDAAAGSWRSEWRAAAARVLWFDAPGAGHAPLLLVERDGEWILHRRREGRWDSGLRIGRTASPATAAWVLAIDEPLPTGPSLLLAVDAGDSSRLLRVRSDDRVVDESVPGGERITGLAAHDGTPVVALLGPRVARIMRRIGSPVGAWITAAAWDASRGALHGLASLSPEEPALAGVLDRGEALRIDPVRGEVRVEADLAGALARQWGAAVPAVAPQSSSAVSLRHPHAGDRVHVLGLGLADPREAQRRGWYVVRQAGGHYAYGLAAAAGGAAGAALRRLVASPFVADGEGAYFALDEGDPPQVRRAWLAQPRIAGGAWADRTSTGRGIVLERTRGGWVGLLYRIEPDGSPRWYSAGGTLREDRLVATTGLVRHQRDADGRLAVETVGTLAIRFGVDGDDPACAGASRRGARALAVLEVNIGDAVQVDCIEPLRPALAARPVVDGSGLWMSPDGAWGLAVQSTGPGPEGDERALVFHFDAAGQPRWVAGTGSRRSGEAVVALAGDAGSGRVSYAFRGACGAVAGSASLVMPAAAGEPPWMASGTVLLRAAGGACY